MNKQTEYNGWKNKQTWVAATIIGNDETAYNLALQADSYKHFVKLIHDNVEDNSIYFPLATWELDTDALFELITELKV